MRILLNYISKQIIGLLIIVCFFSCQHTTDTPQALAHRPTTGEWEQTEIKYAKKFDVTYHPENACKVIRIIEPFSGSKDTLIYVLREAGGQIPTAIEKKAESVIEIPVKSAGSLSTAHLNFFEKIDVLPLLTAIADTKFISNKEVKKRLSNNEIYDLGSSQQPNKETLMGVQPQIVTHTIYSASQMGLGKEFQRSNIFYVPVAEWQENTPLGRAEWIKFFACFFNKEKEANALFKQIETNYLASKAIAKEIVNKPKVLTGLAFQGAWHIPNDHSFFAQFLTDAGAELPWENNKGTASTPMAFEVVYEKGNLCDYWINMSGIRDRNELLQTDPRFQDFKAVKQHHVFNNNKRVNEQGWNEYYETSILNPDIVLKDLIKIFHPELLPEHTLYYYKPLK